MIQVCTGLRGNITSCKSWIFQSRILQSIPSFGSIPWINSEIKKAMTKQNTLWRHLKQNNASSAIDCIRYTATRNKVVSLLRESKHQFFDKLNNSSTKQFWKTMRILNR